MPLKDIDHNSFGSDLYLRVTSESRKLIDQYDFESNVTTFIDQIEGRLWYDVPFAFPYKIFEEREYGTRIWVFNRYNENGEHVYDNGLINIRNWSSCYKEIVVTDFSKYKLYM